MILLTAMGCQSSGDASSADEEGTNIEERAASPGGASDVGAAGHNHVPEDASDSDTAVQSAPVQALTVQDALRTLYPDDKTARADADARCPDGDRPTRIGCLLSDRYADDAKAAVLAARLYDTHGSVAGVERAHTSKVGWRGVIEFVPHLPVGKERKHLKWVVAGFDDIDTVLTGLSEAAPPGRAVTFRFEDLAFRFFRSVDRTTPSAYAGDWTVAYNVDGSLLKSERSVRETLFHEIFHLNDQDHDGWSRGALGPTYRNIMKECTPVGEKTPTTRCLKPFAPSKTKVKGGTYYAFTPGNGVHEYAAELALRYFIEQRAMVLELEKKPKPFKCGPIENAEAWVAMSEEFFGGVDLVPPCR